MKFSSNLFEGKAALGLFIFCSMTKTCSSALCLQNCSNLRCPGDQCDMERKNLRRHFARLNETR